MFDIDIEVREKKVHLSASQGGFVSKYCWTYIQEETIKNTVMKDCPIPAIASFSLSHLIWMMDLITYKADPVTSVDSAFIQVQKKKLNNGMDPLGAVWKMLHKIHKTV